MKTGTLSNTPQAHRMTESLLHRLEPYCTRTLEKKILAAKKIEDIMCVNSLTKL